MYCYFVLHSNHVIVGLTMLACTNLLLFCNVLMSVLITYNTVLCFIILFCLHSTTVIVCHIILACNNLILFCNIIMFVFTIYNTVMFF